MHFCEFLLEYVNKKVSICPTAYTGRREPVRDFGHSPKFSCLFSPRGQPKTLHPFNILLFSCSSMMTIADKFECF